MKAAANVDPSRFAVTAMDRIRKTLTAAGKANAFGSPVDEGDLTIREALLGDSLPPSYRSALAVASRIGSPFELLDADASATERERLDEALGIDGDRYFPFCVEEETTYCFDTGQGATANSKPPPSNDKRLLGELPVVAFSEGSRSSIARHFGEWIDAVADAREAALEHAASLPPRLKTLIEELGFAFTLPLVAEVDTADADAVERLLGDQTVAELAREDGRVFGSNGRAKLTLNVDDFSLQCAIKDQSFSFDASDVFRWLRAFRNENFFSQEPPPANRLDTVRDLRDAIPDVVAGEDGSIALEELAATKYHFIGASGKSRNDFYLLGRAQTAEERTTLILHVVDGQVADALGHEEALDQFQVTPEGSMWGLSTGSAIRFAGGKARKFALKRPSGTEIFWQGVGGGGSRLLAWGEGALLEFDGVSFAPFRPDAGLEPSETIVSLVGDGSSISMLVCGSGMGAVARFEGSEWQPIPEERLIKGNLRDLDVWNDVPYVLARDGTIYRCEGDAPAVHNANRRHNAYMNDESRERNLLAVRSFERGLVLASEGGAIVVSDETPVFYGARSTPKKPARIARVGDPHSGQDSAIVLMCGPSVWIFADGAMRPIDLREW